MDSDEQNTGMGLREQNEKLRQMTLPVFFKKMLNRQQQYENNNRQELAGPQRQMRLELAV